MKNMNHRLLFALLLLFITLGTLTSAFAQITPSQDSYTNTATATTNYGAAATLGVASSATSIQTTYIKFDLSSVPAGYTGTNVAKATLKLYVNGVTKAGSLNVDFVNGSWTEKTITSSLAPVLGNAIASSVPLTTANTNDYVLIDVTTAVQDWLNGSEPNDGIALVANSGLSATFDSKENAAQSHPAELDIVFTAGGTITGVETASGSGLTGGGTSGTLSLGLQSCGTKQVLQWNGSAWACATLGSGTGTITGVTAGADLTGGGASGTVTLNLDTTKVPQLGAANTFTQTQVINAANPFSGALQVTSPYQAIVGTMTSNDFFTPAILGSASATGTGTTIGVEGLSATTSGYGVYGDGGSSGTGVYGHSGSGAGLSGAATNGTGVYGTSSSGVGVWGNSTGSVGVYGASGSSHGVQGQSAGQSTAGVSGVNSASGYGVIGQATGSSGQGVWGESFATSWSNGAGPDGVHGITHSNQGTGVSGTNTAQNGIGVWGSDPHGYGFVTDSHVSQARSMGGWAKAMVYTDFTGTIYRCFNSQLAGSAASTPPCGITVTTYTSSQPSNTYIDYVDFGFEIDDRFVAVNFNSSDDGVEGYDLASDPWGRSPSISPSQVAVLDQTHYVPSIASRFYVMVF